MNSSTLVIVTVGIILNNILTHITLWDCFAPKAKEQMQPLHLKGKKAGREVSHTLIKITSHRK